MLKEKFKFLKDHFSSWTKLQIWLGIIFIAVCIAGGVTVFYNDQPDRSEPSNDKIDLISTSADSESGTNVTPSDPLDSSASNSYSKSTSSSKSSNSSSASGTTGNVGGGSPANNSTPTTPESLSATVAFYADSQTNDSTDEQVHQRAVNYILGTSANPVFHAGDLMEDGTQASLDSFNAVTATLRSSRSFYAAQGNNERDSSLYFNNFVFPNNERWYSVNVGNLHMVILDSAYSSTSSDQLNWLVSDLQSSASQSRITGVMFHHPIYPNNDKSMRASYESVFINNGVDFVLSGHNHSYYHSTVSGVNYFVCSGQQSIGYILAKVYSSTISISAYNSSNGLIEIINIPNR